MPRWTKFSSSSPCGRSMWPSPGEPSTWRLCRPSDQVGACRGLDCTASSFRCHGPGWLIPAVGVLTPNQNPWQQCAPRQVPVGGNTPPQLDSQDLPGKAGSIWYFNALSDTVPLRTPDDPRGVMAQVTNNRSDLAFQPEFQYLVADEQNRTAGYSPECDGVYWAWQMAFRAS